MPKSDFHGQFIWYELLTSDPAAAIPFYTQVVGWGTQTWEGGATPYTMWTTEDMPVGGTMKLPDEATAAGAPTHWLPYVGTQDVDATAKKVKDLGGQVLREPDDIPSVGRFAVLADPQGAVFAVYKPQSEPPAAAMGPPRPGRFSWHELATTDHEAAFDFYSQLFGWEKTDAMDMGEMGTYQMYGRDERTLGGMFNKPSEMPGPPAWLCYVMIDDVNAGVERVKQHGGQVLNGPMEVPGGDQIAQCMDPQGGAFSIHSKAAES